MSQRGRNQGWRTIGVEACVSVVGQAVGNGVRERDDRTRPSVVGIGLRGVDWTMGMWEVR